MALERSLIISGALDLLDEVGLEGLTMRRLADALGVQAPSLYWHFSGKPALLDDMADALIARVTERIDSTGDYATTLRSAGYELRRALLTRRDGGRVYAGTFALGENVLGAADLLIGVLLSAGFKNTTAAGTTFSLFYYVLGFVLEEQALQGGPAAVTAAVQRFGAALGEKFPNVRDSLPQLLEGDQNARFAFGIDVLIRGMGRPSDNNPQADKGLTGFLELLRRPGD